MDKKNINTIRVIGYNPCSLIDGEGLREVVYIAECTHKCKGCQNQKYWKDRGKEFFISDIIKKLNQNPITNITISGGDGLTIQYKNTLELLKQLKKQSKKNIWLYTGYTWEELFILKKDEILNYIDVLVDGKFILQKRDITLPFKGSSNQRIINVQKSLKQNKVCEINYDN